MKTHQPHYINRDSHTCKSKAKYPVI